MGDGAEGLGCMGDKVCMYVVLLILACKICA